MGTHVFENRWIGHNQVGTGGIGGVPVVRIFEAGIGFAGWEKVSVVEAHLANSSAGTKHKLDVAPESRQHKRPKDLFDVLQSDFETL